MVGNWRAGTPRCDRTLFVAPDENGGGGAFQPTREDDPMRKSIIGGVVAAGILAVAGLTASAEDKDPAALAKALAEASVSLDQGLLASTREGKPISGKFELAEGALQLSVYTIKGDQFSEVIVDHKSGAFKNAEKITDAGDLKEAKEQSQAMAKAKVPLDQAVANSVKANAGYRAVSVMPELKSGSPVAEITLMKGAEVKNVTAKLD
jgi:hypothetical protein